MTGKTKVLAKMARFLPLLFILGLILFPSQASAVGVGTAPAKLDFSLGLGSSITKTLYVVNTGDTEAHYKVYVDEQYKDWFDIAPEEFSLAPQANKETQITVSPPLYYSFGDHSTHIHVVAANPNLQIGVGAGINVPVHIHISNLLLWVGIGIVVFLAALTVFLIRRRRIAGIGGK